MTLRASSRAFPVEGLSSTPRPTFNTLLLGCFNAGTKMLPLGSKSLFAPYSFEGNSKTIDKVKIQPITASSLFFGRLCHKLQCHHGIVLISSLMSFFNSSRARLRCGNHGAAGCQRRPVNRPPGREPVPGRRNRPRSGHEPSGAMTGPNVYL